MNDLDKIEAIMRDAAFAADVPFVLVALKKEDSPQFEIALTHPEDFKRIKERIFVSTINPFVDEVCRAQAPALTEKPQEALKNIIARDEIETLTYEYHCKAAGLCPIVLEKDICGLFFFLSREAKDRTLKIIESFAKQISLTRAVREYQKIAHDANLKCATMIETSPDAFFTIDTQSGKIRVSPNLGEMTGYDPEEFLQGLMSPEKYVYPEDLQKVKDFYRDAFSGQKVNVEFRLQRKDGNLIWFSIFSNPIFDSSGKLIAIQGVGKDVSEHKKATWELEKSREREQLKTEFMSMISHELRTPLTPIQGYTDVLLSQAGNFTPQQKEALDVIKKQSRRLLNLIDSVLDITRVEYGKPIEIKKEPVSLNAIIEEVLGGMDFQFKEKEIKLEIELSPEIETILADEAKITRVVSNLVGNALKFNHKKGRIGIKTTKIGSDVQLEIWDTGIGMEIENFSKVFDKFYQVDSSYTRSAGGIGMGLAIVREIISAHGGKVWVESGGLGRGSKFIFTLPLT